MAWLKRAPLHPFLLGSYSLLSLLAFNVAEARFSDGWRSLALTLFICAALLLLAQLFTRNWQRSALAASFVLILFFSYGHIYNFLKQIELFGTVIGRHRWMLPAWGVLLVVGLWWLLGRVKQPERSTYTLNVIGVIAVALPIIQLITAQFNQAANPVNTQTNGNLMESQQVQRDVYYIIMDAYSRDDTLLDFFGYDNSSFLNSLDEMGFYVAQCSRSNYPKTRLSLTSSLNMDYLPELGITENDKTELAGRLIRLSKVRRLLEEAGYSTYAFETTFFWTEWEDVDVYLSRNSGQFGTFSALQTFGQLTEFEATYLRTTTVLAMIDLEPLLAQNVVSFISESPRQQHYDLVSYTLDTLPTLAELPGPKFVFAHVIAPHPPYVFDETGTFVPNVEDGSYNAELEYLNMRLEDILQEIISTSEVEPIIILQGDHAGPRTQELPERLNILNAYYFPDGGDAQLYPSISPVNSFRLVFDTYFDSDFGLIEDINYHSISEDFFDFTIYPETRSGCESQ
ncbi:MAG: hypothetical protein DWQ07_24600 [Chloroflexi bacterium]|nr:MAG: hypothetical protein DWQ07_24600 [Chloroflexota bacterium]MBL1196314.1 hypothetical protein [Chloroflexota bacterium]NOH13609.1 sulfatase-like hydrolase/transferase [Chloroflexota bacterium]